MSSVLDTITRICKNSDDETVAVQTLVISYQVINTTDQAGRAVSTPAGVAAGTRFLRTARLSLVKTTKLYMGGDRTITEIETIGNFDDAEVDGDGTVTTVTYIGTSPTNSVTLGIEQTTGILQVGDDA